MASEPNNHSETARIKEAERKKFIAEHQHDTGSVTKKEKTAFWKWFEEMFLSGRSMRSILLDLLNNQLVPEIKDGTRNGLVSLIDMIFYKDSKPAASGTPSSGSFITNYVAYGDKNQQTKAALEANKKKEEETIKAGYDIPSFTSLGDAKKFLNDMHEYVSMFYKMSVLSEQHPEADCRLHLG